MMKWEEDLEQLEYLAEWSRTHKRWIVKVYAITPPWEECQVYHICRYFTHKKVAQIYAAWMKLWYPKDQVILEREV